jgi:hypothetical protein
MENNQQVPVVESPGAYYPQDFSITDTQSIDRKWPTI